MDGWNNEIRHGSFGFLLALSNNRSRPPSSSFSVCTRAEFPLGKTVSGVIGERDWAIDRSMEYRMDGLNIASFPPIVWFSLLLS